MPKTARIMAVAAVVMCAACAFGSMQDKLARFSTPGPDRYADGSIVQDGECYALVWSPAGTAFAGFNADGTPVSSRDRVVLAGALALRTASVATPFSRFPLRNMRRSKAANGPCALSIRATSPACPPARGTASPCA